MSVFPQTFSNSELKVDEKEDNDYSQDSFPVVKEEQSNSIVIEQADGSHFGTAPGAEIVPQITASAITENYSSNQFAASSA